MSKKMKKPQKTCDPSLCDECQYICEGDFLCERYQEIVVADWLPTDNYLMCQKEGA